ncbi:MAG: hypothetical protein V1781_01405 [Bacteroidota bacterium]
MNPHQIFSAFALIVFLFFNTPCFTQSTDDAENNHSKNKNGKGFHVGLYLGSYFANKYTAGIYDGYGLDNNGIKNNFANSFMRHRIVIEYGGGNGQIDQIAQVMNINSGDWNFDETDMPVNMKYNSAFLAGAQILYGITQKDALLLNINAAKLTLNGNFTITITTLPIGPQQPNYENIKTFSIIGGEQRIMFQMGYRRILGDDDMFNFFVEGGLTLNMTKFIRNMITINSLQIDLSTYYTNPYYTTYRAKYLSGVGLGTFTSLGLNIRVNPKWNIQLLYTPSYERINIGENPRYTLQNAIGVRAFYNL